MQQAFLRPPYQPRSPSALSPCLQRGPISTVPFCLLDPWPPKLPASRSEAPLAFRMKSADFLNSSGHSCIRSGPCAFPMQCVKFVFEGWGRVGLENDYFPLVHTHRPPNSGGTLSSSVFFSSVFLTSRARNQLWGQRDQFLSDVRLRVFSFLWVPQNDGERGGCGHLLDLPQGAVMLLAPGLWSS